MPFRPPKQCTWTEEECFNLCEGNTDYCATHNHALRKQAKADSKPKKEPYKIPTHSKTGARKEAAKQKAYDIVKATQPHSCSNCGTIHDLTPSHVLPQSQWGTFAADPRNIILDCVECHNWWEHGTLEDCEQLTNWKQRLDIIQELAPIYFFRRFGQLLHEYRRQKNI